MLTTILSTMKTVKLTKAQAGQRGGKARAAKLSSRRRVQIAREAAAARWANFRRLHVLEAGLTQNKEGK